MRIANGELATHQRIDAWRLWPEPDFPRTHTLKIRRDAVREWAAADVPLQVREEAGVLATSGPGPATHRPDHVERPLGRIRVAGAVAGPPGEHHRAADLGHLKLGVQGIVGLAEA